MAPTTQFQRLQSPPRTPTRSLIKKKEFSTNRKYLFILKHEEEAGITSFASICRDMEITTPCGRKWLKQRDELGDLAWHKTRKLSKKLRGPQYATKEEIQALVNPVRNPIHNRPLEAQIDLLQIKLGPNKYESNLRRIHTVEESIRQHLYRRKSLRKTSKSGQNTGYSSSYIQSVSTRQGYSLQIRHILTVHHKQLLQ